MPGLMFCLLFPSQFPSHLREDDIGAQLLLSVQQGLAFLKILFPNTVTPGVIRVRTQCMNMFGWWDTLGPLTLVFKELGHQIVTGGGVVTWATIQGSFHPVTDPGFSSSRSSCWRQGGSCLSLHGLRVLAAPAQAEWRHPEVHRILLPPLPHSKLLNTQVLFLDLTEDAFSSSASLPLVLWWFFFLWGCLHTQSKVLIYTFLQSSPASSVPGATVYLAASQVPATHLSGSQCRGHNCYSLDSTYWLHCWVPH